MKNIAFILFVLSLSNMLFAQSCTDRNCWRKEMMMIANQPKNGSFDSRAKLKELDSLKETEKLELAFLQYCQAFLLQEFEDKNEEAQVLLTQALPLLKVDKAHPQDYLSALLLSVESLKNMSKDKQAYKQMLLIDTLYTEYKQQLPQGFYMEYQIHKGELLTNVGKLKEAREHLQALIVERKGKQTLNDSKTQVILAKVYRKEGLYQEAYKIMQKQKQLLTSNHKEELTMLASFYFDFGALCKSMGEFNQAEDYYRESLAIREKLYGKENREYASTLNNLATLYNTIGQMDEAERLLLEVKRIKEAIYEESDKSYLITLNNLAVFYFKLNKYDLAEPLFLKVKAIRERTVGKNNPTYFTALNNLAVFYKQQHEYGKAEMMYREVLELKKSFQGENTPTYINSLLNYAVFLNTIKELKKAEELYLLAEQKTLKIYGKEHLKYALFLNNVSSFYEKKKDYEKALQKRLQALSIFTSKLGMQHERVINVFNGVTRNYNVLQNREKEKEFIDKALAINTNGVLTVDRIIANPVSIKGVEVLHRLSFITTLRNLYDYQTAVFKAKNASKEIFDFLQVFIYETENINRSLYSAKDKRRLLKTLQDTTNIYALKLAVQLKDESYIKASYQFANTEKYLLTQKNLSDNYLRKSSNLPDSIYNQEKLLTKRLRGLRKKIASTSNKKSAKYQALQKQEVELKLEIDAFISVLKEQYPKYYQLKYSSQNIEVEQIQSVLAEDEVFVDYIYKDNNLFVYCIDRERVVLKQLNANVRELSKQTLKLRGFLNKNLNKQVDFKDYTQLSHELYQSLIEPLELGDNKRIIITGDGFLYTVPFEVFLTKAVEDYSNQHYKNLPYLMRDYLLSYNYSVTDFYNARKKQLAQYEGGFLAFAPSYPKLEDREAHVRGNNLSKIRANFQNLPFAQDELNFLSKRYQGAFFVGEEATERVYKNQVEKAQIIHLAMHAHVIASKSELSSLVFYEDFSEEEDNFLYTHEIANQLYNTELVVLSACETGVGNYTKKKGLSSVAQLFLDAGVPAMLVSLWQVNDKATMLIMQSYYEYLEAGNTKDQALQKAKLDYLENMEEEGCHPFYWAPFVQLGDAKAIELPVKSNLWYYLGGISILVCIFAFVSTRKRA